MSTPVTPTKRLHIPSRSFRFTSSDEDDLNEEVRIWSPTSSGTSTKVAAKGSGDGKVGGGTPSKKRKQTQDKGNRNGRAHDNDGQGEEGRGEDEVQDEENPGATQSRKPIPWTAEEDSALLEAMLEQLKPDWGVLSQRLEPISNIARTKDSIRFHWSRTLLPALKKVPSSLANGKR